MEKTLPAELEVIALKTLISYVILVLDKNQKSRLSEMVKARPIEVSDNAPDPKHLEYLMDMQESIREVVQNALKY